MLFHDCLLLEASPGLEDVDRARISLLGRPIWVRFGGVLLDLDDFRGVRVRPCSLVVLCYFSGAFG